LTTRKQVNEIYCKGKEFPLSADELSIVEGGKVRGSTLGVTTVRPAAPDLKAPVVPAEQREGAKDTEKREDAGAVTLPSNRISDFFRRIFDRFW